MSSRSYYVRADLSRDSFSKSRRHLGAADREWRSGKVTSRRVIEKPKSSASIKKYLIGSACFLFVCIVIAIIVVIKNRDSDDPPVEPITCAPGFTGEKCDSTSFIGSQSWSDTLSHKLSDGKYFSKVEVYNQNTPILAFVCVKYTHSLYLSSPVLLKMPSQMQVIAEPKTSRLIYDSDMDTDDFLVPNDYDLKYDVEKLVMEKGPFDISGVCSMTGQLKTFKLGDQKYKVKDNSALKLLLCVKEKCSVTFLLQNKDKEEFECVRDLGPEDGWASVTLEPFEFKSHKCVLSDWKDIVSINIISGDVKLLLNSMLWV